MLHVWPCRGDSASSFSAPRTQKKNHASGEGSQLNGSVKQQAFCSEGKRHTNVKGSGTFNPKSLINGLLTIFAIDLAALVAISNEGKPIGL